MELKEKVKLTMSSINRKITALIMAMSSIGVKLAAYVSKDGSVLINTPSDVIAVGDVVTIEKEGVIEDKANWEGVIVGADAEYKVSIVDGIVKELVKVESEAKEEGEQEKPSDEQSQELVSAFNTLAVMNEKLISKVEQLQTELNAVKKQNETIWKQLQNNDKTKTHAASTKLSKLREIYNNV